MENNNDAKYKEALTRFNANPTSGNAQSYLLEQGLIHAETAAHEMAIILHAQATSVDKTALGIFFAHSNSEDTLKNYLQAMKFTGLTVDEALRTFLDRFRLPGEAQMIDRILNVFAQEYHNQNNALASDANEIYMLVFAVVMLNSDLHNIHGQERMTKAQFVTMAKQVADFCPVPILEEIYNRVAATPLF